MAQYSPKASAKVERAMQERNQGTLKSGQSKKKVTSRKQAIAIGLSEARAEGAKVPKKSAAKKVAKKTAANKVPTKKSVAKKTTVNKAIVKKPAKKIARQTAGQ